MTVIKVKVKVSVIFAIFTVPFLSGHISQKVYISM